MATLITQRDRASREDGDALGAERSSQPVPHRSQNQAVAAEAARRRAERGTSSDQLGVESQPENESLDGNLEDGLGVPVSNHRLSLRLNLGPGQTLFRDADSRLHTTEGAGVSLVIDERGIHVSCSGIAVQHDPDGFFSPSIDVNMIRWEYGGPVSVDSSANFFVDKLGNPDAAIANAVQAGIVDKLPEHMQAEGYNPYEDAALLGNLQAIFNGPTESGNESDAKSSDEEEAGSLDSEESGLGVETSGAEIAFGFTIDEQLSVGGDGSPAVVFAAGSHMRASALSRGGIPDSPEKLQLDRLEVRCAAEVAVQVFESDFKPLVIRSIVVAGGAVRFEYDLITEDVSDLVKLLGAVIAIRGGVPARDLSLRPSRHDSLRKVIDEKLNENAVPLLHQLLGEHSGNLPGFDLLKALGFDSPGTATSTTEPRPDEDVETTPETLTSDAQGSEAVGALEDDIEVAGIAPPGMERESEPPSSSVDETIESGLGKPVSAHGMTFELGLGAGQTLFRDSENRLFTEENARVSVAILGGEIVVTSSGLTIENNPDGFFSPHIGVNMIRWPYGGAVSVNTEASWLVEKAGDPSGAVAAVVEQTLAEKLPAHMKSADYNPYEDPGLIGTIQSLFSGPVENAPEMDVATQDALVKFGFTLDEEIRIGQDGADMALVFAAGSQMSATAESKQGIPENPESFRLDKLQLDCAAEVAVRIADDARPVIIRSIAIEHGGAVAFEYDVVTDGGADLGDALDAFDANGRRPSERFLLRPVEMADVRQQVDARLHQNATPIIRELLRNHGDKLPGVDLLTALGLR